ncbi:NUDIX domain-containing protein [Streptacidiphilus sp. EB103A]|uniref:NUDIX domain-containing protein n=1 Tax=Streptacidiphilus sp. EB103A TaxID=3156275 RepID=UPI003518F2C9
MIEPVIRNSAKAVVVHAGRVLLQQTEWGGQSVRFLPGGGQHPGEPLARTVVREVLEETGLTVRVERLLWLREFVNRPWGSNGASPPATHRVEAIFLCLPVGEPGALGGPLPDEFQTGLEWVPLEAASWPGTKLLPIAVRDRIAALAHSVPGWPDPYLGDTP